MNTFCFKLSDLKIDTSSIYRLMGFDLLDVPEPFPEMVDHELRAIESLCDIRGGYRIVDQVEINAKESAVCVSSHTFNVGKMVAGFLKKSEQIALFVCTAGKKLEIRSKRYMDQDMLLEGYIVDVLGSVIVESAMDIIHQKLISDMKKEGLGVSNRYSPGYCSWDVSEQKSLFSFFPDQYCGITLSDSCLMSPIKSVSGIIGVGQDVNYKQYMCSKCNSVNCIYRNKKN